MSRQLGVCHIHLLCRGCRVVMGPAALDRYKWRYHSGCGAGLGFCLGLRLGLGVGLGDSLGLNLVPPELRRALGAVGSSGSWRRSTWVILVESLALA